MTEVAITVTFETDNLSSYTDQYVATLWHVAQANPVDGFKNREPGDVAERIGREIIRRFIKRIGPELWNHQGSHFEFGRHLDHKTGDV